MKRILTAVVLIPIVLLIVFRAPGWLFAAVVGLTALLATWEYLDITEAYPAKPLRLPTLTLIVVLFTYGALAEGFGYGGDMTVFILAVLSILSPFIFLAMGMRRDDLREGFMAAAVSFLAFPYIGLSLWCLLLLRSMGWEFVLFVLLVVWVGDTCAYYVGRSVGRHLMAPRISPKKTWEGAIASIIGSVVVGVFVLRYAPEISVALQRASLLSPEHYRSFVPNPLACGVIAALVNMAGQMGDLVESSIKRGANVKDSGSLLPGHGGILDRIDALLFAAPIAAWLFSLSFVFRVKDVG